MDFSVPTRIVSEDPFECHGEGFLRITQSSRIFTSRLNRVKYRRLSGRPRIQGRPLNGFQTFPIKAPTRQMLYPLSYRGIAFNGLGMLTPVIDAVNRGDS